MHRSERTLFSTTPGFSTSSGSNSDLRRHIRSYALPPHSISTYGATLRPVPCSPCSAAAQVRPDKPPHASYSRLTDHML